MISTDKQLHILTSGALVLFFAALKTEPIKPVLAIGLVVEVLDHNAGEKDCLEDMAANILGITLGLIIIKTLKWIK